MDYYLISLSVMSPVLISVAHLLNGHQRGFVVTQSKSTIRNREAIHSSSSQTRVFKKVISCINVNFGHALFQIDSVSFVLPGESCLNEHFLNVNATHSTSVSVATYTKKANLSACREKKEDFANDGHENIKTHKRSKS